jgi:lysozyme family protein
MLENFAKSLEAVLEHEGGYVDHPKDPGGRTNMGITQAVYEKYLNRSVTEEEMKNIKIGDVRIIYKTNYWDKVKGDDLPSGVDFCVFDWAVNSGVSRSSKALQKIVGATSDGVIGPNTLKAVYSIDAQTIITKLTDDREAFYKKLSTFDTFGKGWLRRNEKTKLLGLNLTENSVQGVA